ncbi:MAG: ABC transporter permease [Chloroflexi bacterium]|nr:MAG: ABC transporter permease [Chloroflexota bacterium]
MSQEALGQSSPPSSTSTAGAAHALTELGSLRQKKARSLWSNAWRQFRKHRLAMAGMVTLGILVLMSVFGPGLWGKSGTAIDFGIAIKGPSLSHPMGTDDLGRDIFARVLWGGRISLAVGVVAMLVAITLGALIGAMAGFFGGVIDSTLMRITDMFISLPDLPLLLLTIYLFRDKLRAQFGPTLGIFLLIVFLIGILNWMPVARLVRASFLSLKEKEFTEAARCIGASRSSIIFRHIMPNVLGPVIVAATLAVGSSIITESALSFLGLGFPPDVPTWGRLLYDSINFMELAPWMVIFPALMIFLAVLSINYVGDGLRDALDPRKTG